MAPSNRRLITATRTYGDAPALGEHNADIVRGPLGLDRKEIERLTKERAIA
jgi:crotonobetainyl-CoA:carnitine CoA-transferase CaiB-like acyl-CoA transferase